MTVSFTPNMEPVRQTPTTPDKDADRRMAVVMPLFHHADSPRVQWEPSATKQKPLDPRWWMLGGTVIACAVVAFVFHSQQGVSRVGERIEVGCLDVDDCRALVQAAESAKDACWVGCSTLTAMVSKARTRFRSALEEAAVQERLRQDHDYAQSLVEQREVEAARAERAHEQRMEEMDRRHVHALALVVAETERQRAERAQLAANQIVYFRHLSREQRSRRLLACQNRGTNCEELVRLLVDAAASPAERAHLVESHESVVTAQPSPEVGSEARESAATPAPKPGNSTMNEPALL